MPSHQGWRFLLALLLVPESVWGAEVDATEAAAPVDYVQQVRPILSHRCYACHGALKQKNGLRLDTTELAIQGGDGGAAVVPGKSDESLLIDAILGESGVSKMPPEGEPLKPEEIATLRRWIDEGARHPEEKIPEDPAKHWSYQPPVRPAIPAVRNPDWVRNPIDAFVAAGHEQQGVTASPQAAKHLLLRRVYLDLIGLPPTRPELEAFLADDSPDAYEKVVARLLESSHYGERWGRHWMDVWRYSDWDGFGAEVRESQPHIWRWRDWIIESLNADKPYDQMIVEMLAGDELAPSDPQTIRATGFLVRNWYKFSRNVWLDFTVEHTGKAFLATTFNCARCHDHMYDPIAQQDYYKLRSFFEAHDIRTDKVPGQPDTTKDGLARVYDAKAEAPTFLFVRGDDKRPDKDHPLQPGLPVVLARSEMQIAPVTLAPTEYYPGLRPAAQQEVLAQAQSGFDSARKNWMDSHAKLVAARQKLTEFVAAKSKPPEPQDKPRVVLLTDNFSAARPEMWVQSPGLWEYKEGRLVQSDPRDAITQMLSVATHPADFVGKFRFKTTGGDVYKSVGLSFDAEEDRDFWAVYLSGVGKLSIFRRVNGQDQYFNDGLRDFPVELGREYELQVAVRGTLVNVSVDGQLVFVYKLAPDRKKDGHFGCWTFDATAEFVSASVEELPAETPLYEKLDGAPVPANETDLQNAIVAGESAVSLADKSLAVATIFQQWVQARVAADNANYAIPPAPNAQELSLAAGRAEREHALRAAERNLLEAEQKLAAAKAVANPDDKAKKTLADAEAAAAATLKARNDAQAALPQPLADYARFGPVYPTTTTGRRLALARWIANRNNPLTARVAINHMWLRHFGAALVPSMFDFGLNGKKSVNQPLLDWLAVELMEPSGESGAWRMKHVHRLIVTSNTYRQQSTAIGAQAEANKQVDPDNLSLWRMNVRRMEAEIVRDSTLHTAGSLDATMAGPELDENAGMTTARRSVYYRNSKEKKMTFLDLFDRPNVVECYRRSESIVPQQALAMANSPLSLAQSRVLAKKLSAETGVEAQPEQITRFVTTAFVQILNRPPTAEEQAECERFLGEQSQKFAKPQELTQFTAGAASPVPPATDPHQRARENLVHVLLNHNDFLTVR